MKKNDRQLLKTNGSAESDEYKKLITLILIIVAVFALVYGATVLFTSKKNKDNIFKNDLNPSEIQYKEIIIGNMFDKDGEYYVLLLEKDEPYKESFDSYINSVKQDNKVYTVDLSSAFNKEYISDENSYDEEDFKVKGTVLVKIDDHKIVDHYEDKSEILEKLDSLTK